MWHSGAAAKNVPDGVAGAEPSSSDDAGHRHPGAHQTVQTRLEISRICLHARKAIAEQHECLQAGPVGIVVGID